MDRHNARERLLQQLARAKESAGPLERLLSQSKSELRHSPEMETLERVVAHLALYFGYVFDAVAIYGKILQVDTDRYDPRRAYAELILDDAKAGKRLTADLLRNKGTATLRLLTLDRFIRELAPLLSQIVEKRIKLRTVRCVSVIPT